MKQLSLLEHFRLRFPERSDVEHVERIAADTIKELGERPPVDLEVVASYRGIAEIRLEPLPFAGCLGPEDGRIVMRIRRGDSARRRRFTGFHEIGHSFQPGFREHHHFRCSAPSAVPRGRADPEALADVAAAELLLPAEYFISDARSSPFGIETVIELAGAYDASIQATTYRFARFWPEPMLALVLEPGLRKGERGDPFAEPRLRVRSAHTQGPWPFIPRNKSAAAGGPLERALAGELIEERATLSDLGIEDAGPLQVSARRFSYVNGDGEVVERVIALYRPRSSRRKRPPRREPAMHA